MEEAFQKKLLSRFPGVAFQLCYTHIDAHGRQQSLLIDGKQFYYSWNIELKTYDENDTPLTYKAFIKVILPKIKQFIEETKEIPSN